MLVLVSGEGKRCRPDELKADEAASCRTMGHHKAAAERESESSKVSPEFRVWCPRNSPFTQEHRSSENEPHTPFHHVSDGPRGSPGSAETR